MSADPNRVPWGNMYEFTISGTFVIALIYLVLYRRFSLAWMGPLVVGTVLTLLSTGTGTPGGLGVHHLVVDAAYLHARTTAGWKGRNAAILALVGTATLWFDFIGINYFSSFVASTRTPMQRRPRWR